MAAASSEPSPQGPARRLGLLYSAIACLGVFVGAAWWSWRYAPLPDPFKPAESRTFGQWLTTPIEHNAFRRLPVITGDLNGVFALKGTEQVWVVGQGGMILHSADGGESWEQQADINWSPTVPPAETAEVQRLLRELGYDPGRADGRPGAKARAAIEQFQRDAGLPVDGKLTVALRERLQKESAVRKVRVTGAGRISESPDTVSGLGTVGSSNLPPEPGVRGSSGGGLPAPSPSRADLRAVAFADELLGIAVGDQGVILRTLDGGARWRRVASGTEAKLEAVAFADAERALAVGNGGTVLGSTDGASTGRSGRGLPRNGLLRSPLPTRSMRWLWAGTPCSSPPTGARHGRRGRRPGHRFLRSPSRMANARWRWGAATFTYRPTGARPGKGKP